MGKSCKYLSITAILLLALLPACLAVAQDKIEQSPDEKARQQMLEREAANALRRLKRSMEKDGFYSGRVALNIWRSNAMDAGTFDQAQYDAYKSQLYEKSVSDSLRCFEDYLLGEDLYSANFCLQTWRMHSKELGTYDQAEYEEFKKRLVDAKAAKASRPRATKRVHNEPSEALNNAAADILAASLETILGILDFVLLAFDLALLAELRIER